MFNNITTIVIIVLLSISNIESQDYQDLPPERFVPEWKAIPPVFEGTWDTVNVNNHGIMPNDQSGVAASLLDMINNHSGNILYYFPEGDYYFEKPLLFDDHDNDDDITDHFIIRGAGPNKTRFLFDCDVPYFKGLIWVEDGHGYYSRDNMLVPTTQTPMAGDTELHLDESDNHFNDIQPGTIICIKQDNDHSLMFPEGSSDRRWYEKWQNGQADWAEESMGQFCKVTSINGNVVTIAEPIGIDFTESLSPRVSVHDQVAQNIGIEDIYIEHIVDDSQHTPGGTNDVFGIVFRFTENCYVNNVHSHNTARGHIIIEYGYNISIMNSVFSYARNYGTGGAAYGVAVQNRASNIYIANNEFDHLRHSVVLKEGANHCVIAYNWSHDWAIIDPEIEIEAEADMSIHGFYSHNNLFEGNVCNNIFYADYWGPTGPKTVAYRNKCYGIDTLDGIYVDDYSHHESVVANILPAACNLWVDTSCQDAYLEGNVVDGSTQWNTLGQGASLPASLYLWGGEPDFWIDGLPFPPYGPDVTDAVNNYIPANYDSTTVQIPAYQLPECSVYPNPFELSLYISSPENRHYQIAIKDLTGRTVMSDDVHTADYVWSPSEHLPEGIYFVIIKWDGRHSIIKQIIHQ
jgi:hypothetical protein